MTDYDDFDSYDFDDSDERAHARSTDPETSHEAAGRIDLPEKIEQIREVFEARHRSGIVTTGLTTSQLGACLVCPRDWISSTVTKMYRKGILTITGFLVDPSSNRRNNIYDLAPPKEQEETPTPEVVEAA